MSKDREPGDGRTTFALVIPTHRRPDLVVQAVDSALRQRRPFDQVIVVPDGLDDPAVDALRGRPVAVVPIDKAGVAAARNAGLAHAETDWVCFLDDDDLLHPQYLERVEVESQAGVKALNTGFWVFSDGDTEESEFRAKTLDECLSASSTVTPSRALDYLRIEGRSFDLLLERLRGSMSTAAIRRDLLLEAGGFPIGVIAGEDWAMYVNVARLTEWRFVPDRLAFFRDHPNTVTRTGSAAKGLATLRVIHSFWQPTSLPTPPHRPLDAYSDDYRHVLHWALRASVRGRDFTAYRQALRLGSDLLPRMRDRIWAATPDWSHRVARRISALAADLHPRADSHPEPTNESAR